MSGHERVARYRKNRRLLLERSIELQKLDPIVGYGQEPLLPLIETCKPLLHIVDDVLHYASIAFKTTSRRPPHGLTRDESAAICLYTMEWDDDHNSLYFLLNGTLRMGDRSELQPWFRYLKLFLTGLVKIPCAQTQTVWRGLRHNVSDAFPPGTEVTWWSFSSCTTVLTVLESELYLGQTGERTLFSVEIINGRDISSHSYYKNEDEVLLLPGTYMEVRSQLNPAPDMHIIHLRQTIPTSMLLEPPFEGAPLFPTGEQMNMHPSEIGFWRSYFMSSWKNSWYRQKKFLIPAGILVMLCIVGIVLGSVIGTKMSQTVLETTTTPIQTIGICPNARWIEFGITVAGDKSAGQDVDLLHSADGIFVKEDGTLYIADGLNSRIMRRDVGASHSYVVAGGNGLGNSANQLNFPVDLFVDQNGTMYITDHPNQRVQQWSQGALYGRTLLSNHIFIGIGLDDQGSLYTSDWTNNALIKWPKNDSVGQILVSGFIIPDRLYVDRNQSIYVVDKGNHSIIKIAGGTGNTSIVAGGRQGNNLNALSSPRGVTVDELGSVYVADTENNRVVRWSPGATTGVLIVGDRGEGSKSNQLYKPTDLQFDQYGNLYVADSANNRVQKFLVDKSLC